MKRPSRPEPLGEAYNSWSPALLSPWFLQIPIRHSPKRTQARHRSCADTALPVLDLPYLRAYQPQLASRVLRFPAHLVPRREMQTEICSNVPLCPMSPHPERLGTTLQ